jgi:signal transduction histidine kinase
VGEDTEGAFARFLQDKLKLLFWYRSPKDRDLVFGAQVELARLVAELRGAFRVEPELGRHICAALLDDMGRPMAVSRADFKTDWRRPFVSSEVGEVLPHWEVGVYLLDPARLSQSARTLRLTLGLLIALLVLAIGAGSWLIVADVRRQLTLARQKTDFVSNVSHELKTPLTSIRMFSELLAEERVQDDAKRRQYLSIITAEAARLTRLINNVLDFARLERGEKKYQFEPCDLAALAREALEAYRPHLEAHGFRLDCQTPAQPVMVRGEGDALAQVLVNLLSNAEKYSGDGKEIFVRLEVTAGEARVRVLDRGSGVPPGCEEKIFEQFYRAHDSLSSGIQGSGLGLTLARQIVRAHGGEVTYEPRSDGGSCFIVTLPRLRDGKGGGCQLPSERGL